MKYPALNLFEIIVWASRLICLSHVRYSYYYKFGTKSNDGLTEHLWYYYLYPLKEEPAQLPTQPPGKRIFSYFTQGLAHLDGAVDLLARAQLWSGHYPFPLI